MDTAAQVWQEVERVVRNWQPLARKLGMDDSSLIDFSAAFLV